MSRAEAVRLVADIGGTHARFALVKTGSHRLLNYRELVTNDYAALAPAIEDYLASSALPWPNEAAVAIANPVQGDRIQMTNTRWSFSRRATQARLGLKRLLVLNDFAALALSIPKLNAKQSKKIGPGRAVPKAPIALIGPGTGLGMAGLVYVADQWSAIASEGGHVTAAASNDLEAQVIALLRQRFNHVSAERLVSGPGLVNLYQSLCTIHGQVPLSLDAQGISAAAKGPHARALCRAAVELLCAFLGGLAGDLALTLGARGGVYLGGGIIPALGDVFEHSAFRTRFIDKGRMQPMLEAIPTFVIEAPHAAMLGDLHALEHL